LRFSGLFQVELSLLSLSHAFSEKQLREYSKSFVNDKRSKL
jgi:hypothetical protein